MKKLLFTTLFLAVLSITACKKIDPTLEVSFDSPASMGVGPYTYIKINYTVVSGPGTANLTVEDVSAKPGSIKSLNVNRTDENGLGGYISVRFAEAISAGTKILVKVDNGYTFQEYGFEYEMEDFQTAGQTEFSLSPEGGVITLGYNTNTDVNISISEDAKSWLKLDVEKDGSKAMTSYTFALVCSENPEFARTAEVTVKSVSGKLSGVYTINQKGASKEFYYTTTNNPAKAPELLGEAPRAMVYWGDTANSYMWTAGMTHPYNDGQGAHTVQFSTLNCDGFAFESLEGITAINLKDFK